MAVFCSATGRRPRDKSTCFDRGTRPQQPGESTAQLLGMSPANRAACFKGDRHHIANNTVFDSWDDAVTAALFG